MSPIAGRDSAPYISWKPLKTWFSSALIIQFSRVSFWNNNALDNQLLHIQKDSFQLVFNYIHIILKNPIFEFNNIDFFVQTTQKNECSIFFSAKNGT